MPRVSTTVVFSEDALAPGAAALWQAALEHLARRYASIRDLDPDALPADRTAAAAALDAWDGGAGWRREVGRYYDDHARLHLRRDPATGALLRRLKADGSQLGAYGAGPREASEAVLRFLGLDRRLDAVCLEPDVDGFTAACAALGADAGSTRHVRTPDEAQRL
jgi:phosphoglycolate phosphatase-like HAD superfamily hydrolase